ncbi:hypothetical protein [Bradyrhizobium sp. USDA 4369]
MALTSSEQAAFCSCVQAEFARERKEREVERLREDAAWEDEWARCEKLIAKAQAALEVAQRQPEEHRKLSKPSGAT